MKKIMIIDVEDGNFDDGFKKVTVKVQKITENGQINYYQIPCQFPPVPELPKYYQNWQKKYGEYPKSHWNLRGIKRSQMTNFSMREYIDQCNQSLGDLRQSLNNWLSSVKKQLESTPDIDSQEEIQVVIQTQKINCEFTKNLLHKLPWHWWDLVDDKYFSEVVLSFVDSEQILPITQPIQTTERPRRVKILCVLGDDRDGIDVEADRRLIQKIPGAYPVFSRQPTLQSLKEMLKERWDIFVYSGHSKTEGGTAFLEINPQESLNIQDIKKVIEPAIKAGMKLAIFNSCDGLGFARQLSNLDIAQIIVWREPVPNKVAQEFLKYFLGYFTTGLSLNRSVQEARFKIQAYIENNEKLQLPEVSWLPVIHQNLAQAPITWQQLRGYQDIAFPFKIGNYDLVKRKNVNVVLQLIGKCFIFKTSKKDLRVKLLEKVEEFWVKGVLEKSLHCREERSLEKLFHREEMIEMGLNALEQTSGRQWKMSNEQRRNLPPGTRAIDQFDELVGKRTMLILGKPGSGKTIALLEIARELIIDAKQCSTLPIPVVFNLSSWDSEYLRHSQIPLVQWLIKELNRLYKIPQSQGEALINNQQLLLLLDGLDEVEQGQKRDSCVQVINQFMREYDKTQIVICSRFQEYNTLTEKLYCQGKIYLELLKLDQVIRYFDDLGEPLKAVKELLSKKNQSDREDPYLIKLANTPLIVNLITKAYKGISEEELLKINSFEKQRKHLLKTYIDKSLEP